MSDPRPQYHLVAVYPSVLYGEDFVVESIDSILQYVEKVFVVMMTRPWGATAGVMYKGVWVPWPQKFDETHELIASMKEPRVEIIEAYKLSPWNRWGFAVNDIVCKMCNPKEVILIDPDCVFSADEAKRTFSEWDSHLEYFWAQPSQIELWRTPAWQVERPRSMVSLHRGDLSLLSDGAPEKPKMHQLQSKVHNLGFCVSPQSMQWKHLTALAFSPVIGESMPNEDWYEDRWLAWQPETNNRNLDVSVGTEHAIARAVPYDTSGLPEAIKQRYAAGEWPNYGEVK